MGFTAYLFLHSFESQFIEKGRQIWWEYDALSLNNGEIDRFVDILYLPELDSNTRRILTIPSLTGTISSNVTT